MSGIHRERRSVSIEGELTIAKKNNDAEVVSYQNEHKDTQKIFPDGIHT
jgi:hypothetical protein